MQSETAENPPFQADFLSGGDDRDRTDYLLNAIQALSQVSYAPIGSGRYYTIFSMGLQVLNKKKTCKKVEEGFHFKLVTF